MSLALLEQRAVSAAEAVAPIQAGERVFIGTGCATPHSLVAALEARAARRAAAGLEEEVRELLARGYDERSPAMNGIGYREFVRVVRGTLARPEAIRLMQRDTTRYAKRQHTWFSREPGVEWIDVDAAGGADGVADYIVQSGGGIE